MIAPIKKNSLLGKALTFSNSYERKYYIEFDKSWTREMIDSLINQAVFIAFEFSPDGQVVENLKGEDHIKDYFKEEFKKEIKYLADSEAIQYFKNEKRKLLKEYRFNCKNYHFCNVEDLTTLGKTLAAMAAWDGEELLYTLPDSAINGVRYDPSIEMSQLLMFTIQDALIQKNKIIAYKECISELERPIYLLGDEQKAKISPLINPLDFTFHCNLAENQINTLYDHLSKGHYIDSSITLAEFSETLLGSQTIPKPLQWLKSNRALAYLFRQMHTDGLIDNDKWQSIIEKRCLFFKNSSKKKLFLAQDLSQAITDYQQEGNPRESVNIDIIIREVKAFNNL